MTNAEIVSEINKLPLADWQAIKETVDRSRTNGVGSPQMTEAEFAQYLLAEGIINRIPTGESDDEFDDYEPIMVEGESLSEMIIRERR